MDKGFNHRPSSTTSCSILLPMILIGNSKALMPQQQPASHGDDEKPLQSLNVNFRGLSGMWDIQGDWCGYIARKKAA